MILIEGNIVRICRLCKYISDMKFRARIIYPRRKKGKKINSGIKKKQVDTL